MSRLERTLSVLLLTTILFSLCLYAHYGYTKRHSSITQVQAQPERYENVTFTGEGRAVQVRYANLTTFTLRTLGETIKAVYAGRVSIPEGSHVFVMGTLRTKEGYLLVTRIHIYRNILRLYLLSALGGSLALLIFLRDWRLDLKRLEWRRKNA